MKSENEFYVISNTHWDREWRFPFERTRAMLVEMMDRLLKLFEASEGFKVFHLDAHTAPLEDYLEVRPQKRQEVQRLVRDGRLLVGPWYTLPDACSISGESLVRNLLLGHKQARAFGKVMKVGYTPNGFGQPSQLPQLYAGFGIDSVLFYRGVPRHELKSEFIWESPDGTRALAFRFGSYARYNFFVLVYRPTVHGRKGYQTEYRWDEGGVPFHWCRELSYEPYYLLDFTPKFDASKILPGLEEMLQVDAASMTTPLVAAMHGCDSTAPDDLEVAIVAEANRQLGAEKVFHASLEQYVDKVRAGLKGKDLQVARGEMRQTLHSGGHTRLYPAIYGTRVAVRQQNHMSEIALEQRAEVAAALAWLMGEEYPQGLLDLAWKMLLQNHAHDSIGGCAMDRVHEDVMNRFARCDDIADEVFRASLGRLVTHVNSANLGKDAVLLLVFNPLPYARSETIRAMVDIPQALAAKDVEIIDLELRKVAHQTDKVQKVYPTVQKPNDVPSPYHATRYHVQFEARDIPAMGYRIFVARPAGGRGRRGPAISPAPNELENEFLKAAVNADGTVDLTDKTTGRTFAGLGYFEDGSETGDPWVRMTAETDEIVTSRGGKARVRRIANGPLAAAIEIGVTMKLPLGVTADRKKRQDKRVKCELVTTLSLRKGSHVLDAVTTVNNVVRDHRLRLMLPTRLGAEFSHGHMPFDVVARPVQVADPAGWMEPPTGTHPQKWFVDVSDGKVGLAVLDQGITQYEVVNDAEQPIAMTLMRCFQMRSLIQTIDYPDQGGSQCPGRATYRYALMPHAGDWDAGGVLAAAYLWNVPPVVCQIGTGKGTEPTVASFLEISPPALAFSGMKPGEDGEGALIVRLYNPAEHAVRGEIRAGRDIAAASEVRLDETHVRPLTVEGGRRIPLDVGAKKIMTLKLQMVRPRETRA